MRPVLLRLSLLASISAWLWLALPLYAEEITPSRAQVSPTCAMDENQNDLGVRSSKIITYWVWLPSIGTPTTCPAIPGETYGTVPIISAPTNPPAAVHPDLNLAVRGYITTSAHLGLVDYGGPVDLNSPKLYNLFADHRTASFSQAYKVGCAPWEESNCVDGFVADYPVSLVGMVVTATETIHVPGSGYDIGLVPTGYEAMVLYASPKSITLKYTREDNVVNGYTLHLDNICVEPRLLALYETWNGAGRTRLPALYAGQAFGRAIGGELRVAIRDSGIFMDPCSQGDWWQAQ